MGKKNCELSPEDIQRICDAFLAFEETPQSKIFPNRAFGYWKVKVERPLGLHSQLSRKGIETLRFASGDSEIRSVLYDELSADLFDKPASVASALKERVENWEQSDEEESEEGGTIAKKLPESKRKKLLNAATWKRDAKLLEIGNLLREALGGDLFEDHNEFLAEVKATLKEKDIKVNATELKLIVNAVSWREESAPPVIKKIHKPGKTDPDPFHGHYEAEINGKTCVVEYEPDADLRDHEQVPLLEEGGIEAFIRREALPYTLDAWVVEKDPKIGHEVSFTRHFYEPPKLRSLSEISADIRALEEETEGLLDEITKGAE